MPEERSRSTANLVLFLGARRLKKEFSSVVLNPAANERAAIMVFYGRKDFEQKHAVSCGRVTLPQSDKGKVADDAPEMCRCTRVCLLAR